MLLIAIFTTLLFFLAAVTSLFYLWGHKGGRWLFALLVSGLLLYLSLGPLVEQLVNTLPEFSFSSVSFSRNPADYVLAAIALFWFIQLLVLHRAVSSFDRESAYLTEKRKNLHESRLMEQVEGKNLVRQKRAERKLARLLAKEEQGDLYPSGWATLFAE